MKAIEKKVSSLNDMFVSKIMDSEYEVIGLDKYMAVILIGGKYEFRFWIANDWDSFKTHDMGINFMMLNFSDKQRKELFSRFDKKLDEYSSKDMLGKKKQYLKEIEELESKLGK